MACRVVAQGAHAIFRTKYVCKRLFKMQDSRASATIDWLSVDSQLCYF